MIVALRSDAVGRRIDRALVDAFAREGHPVTRSQLARAFADGRVRATGRPLKPGAVVAAAMTLAVELAPAAAPAKAHAEAIPLRIMHEDGDLLVIDKPAGMVVHASAGHRTGTLVNAVLYHLGRAAADLPTLRGNSSIRPGVVHRLDRDTSGLIVIAKHEGALEQLAAQFRRHSIERSYLGIVRGELEFARRRVETTHARDPADRRRFAPGVAGARRTAVTEVVLVERLAGASLVRFVLETGRTHQVRMHARALGHPLLGDALYGARPRERILRGLAEALGRQALHAAELGFLHPSGETMRFSCELPPDLLRVLDALRARGRAG